MDVNNGMQLGHTGPGDFVNDGSWLLNVYPPGEYCLLRNLPKRKLLKGKHMEFVETKWKEKENGWMGVYGLSRENQKWYGLYTINSRAFDQPGSAPWLLVTKFKEGVPITFGHIKLDCNQSLCLTLVRNRGDRNGILHCGVAVRKIEQPPNPAQLWHFDGRNIRSSFDSTMVLTMSTKLIPDIPYPERTPYNILEYFEVGGPTLEKEVWYTPDSSPYVHARYQNQGWIMKKDGRGTYFAPRGTPRGIAMKNGSMNFSSLALTVFLAHRGQSVQDYNNNPVGLSLMNGVGRQYWRYVRVNGSTAPMKRSQIQPAPVLQKRGLNRIQAPRNRTGKTTIYDVIKLQKLALVKDLALKNANLFEMGPKNISPLFVSARLPDASITELLLRTYPRHRIRERVNHQDDRGYTAMHMAAKGGHVRQAKLLKEHGAQIKARAKDGTTPMDIAEKNNNNAMISYLNQFY